MAITRFKNLPVGAEFYITRYDQIRENRERYHRKISATDAVDEAGQLHQLTPGLRVYLPSDPLPKPATARETEHMLVSKFVLLTNGGEQRESSSGVYVLSQEQWESCLAAARLILRLSEGGKRGGSATSKAKREAAKRNAEKSAASGKSGRPAKNGAGQARNCPRCGKRHAKKGDPCANPGRTIG